MTASPVDRPAGSASAAAVIIFDADGEVVSATDNAEQRIAELDGDLWFRIPATIVSAAKAAAAGLSWLVHGTRVQTRTGQWLSLSAAPVRGRDGSVSEVAVTIDTAGPALTFTQLAESFGLTERERDVVRQVLAGRSTRQIAKQLHLSPYTVQDRLKVIFDKMGVASRRELQAKIFLAQYGDHIGVDGWVVND